jgi:hypothetical protein
MKLTTEDISFVIASYNTRAHTMMAYRIIRPIYETNEIVIVDDGSADGTEDWLLGCAAENDGGWLVGQIALDDDLRGWRNAAGKPLGKASLLDLGIKMARSPMISVFEYGMPCEVGYLEDLLAKWKEDTHNPTMMSKKNYLTRGKVIFAY